MSWKSLLYAAFVVLALQTLGIAQETFYYKKGKKIPLSVDSSKNFVLVESAVDPIEFKSQLNAMGNSVSGFEKVGAFSNLNMLEDSDVGLSEEAAARTSSWAIVDQINVQLEAVEEGRDRRIAYRSPFFKTKSGESIGVSHLIYVKLRDKEGEAALKEMAAGLGAKLVGSNKFMPLWYTLAVDVNSKGNSLEIANKLYESGVFDVAEPDFLIDVKAQGYVAATDPEFAKQWGLKNTGQGGGTAGIDINVSNAWLKATGKSVNVAVIDHGLQLNHPDAPNISSKSFDTLSGTSPSTIHGNHGMACAGIIGASKGNGKGIAGVAPDATLISISDRLVTGPNAQQNIASGISWAWQEGAAVISNSWGHNDLASSFITDAINEALTRGRSGKGCVVVFAAGNSNGAVIYPARDIAGVVCVGAISPCGRRKSPSSCDGESWWGSNYGRQQDVVAPGVLIPTTDLTGASGYSPGDYALTFNGTSSACPHVAGVAALILEVNPALSQKEVADIIELTARKVGPYSYQTVMGRQNGTWNAETGHGLVNAEAAVQMALQSVNPDHSGPSSGPKNDKQTITFDAPASDGKAKIGNVSLVDVEFVGSEAQAVKFPVGIAEDGKVVFARVEFSGPVKKEYYSNLAEMLRIVEE